MLKLSTDNLSYYKKGNEFVTEASDLNLPAREWNEYRVIPAEYKFKVFNPKSKSWRIFKFTDTDKNYEGGVQAWNYKSFDGIKLVIFND